jgi:hypothetical protein
LTIHDEFCARLNKASWNTAAKPRPPDNASTGEKFGLNTMEGLREIASDLFPAGPPMDKMMTQEEMDATGVSGLSSKEKAALERWIGKLPYFAFFRTTADIAQEPNARTAPRPRNIYHYRMQTELPILGEGLAV